MTFRLRRTHAAAAAAALLSTLAAPALAATGTGQPAPWQVDLQGAVTPVFQRMHEFNTFVFVIIAAIVVFVLALLVIVMVRFNEKANPVPSKTTHNALLEVVWTVVPVLILVVIAVPSFRLLYAQYDMPKADLTLKVTGKQWFWTVEYQTAKPATPGQAVAEATAGGAPDFGFDAVMLKDNERKADQPRLLAVDNEIVVPVGKVIRVQVTAADVLHSFAVPSFGIKADAVVGRLNETWFRADKEGVYYGQCSELCGRDHAFMPIAVRVVNEQQYQAWYTQAKAKFASARPAEEKSLADASITSTR